jgi:hypothetical protein
MLSYAIKLSRSSTPVLVSVLDKTIKRYEEYPTIHLQEEINYIMSELSLRANVDLYVYEVFETTLKGLEKRIDKIVWKV